MPSLQDQLSLLLNRLDRPGDFYATGTLDMHPPRMRVEGVGTIALPLLPAQAQELIALAEQAPYGRGTETLVDTGVRRTWQIDAAQLTLEGQRWQEDILALTACIADALGVTGTVEAEPYKLLIYDEGSFFVSHRDTEKGPGMFATLVMILPSDFSGGELIVRHKEREVRLDLRREDPAAIAYAAFYADCRHQVLPVTDGCRLALIYNLFRRDGGPLPKAPDYDHLRVELTDLLRHWADDQAEPDGPNKLILPLEHHYSEAELGFRALKGLDATLAGMVRDAAEQTGCDLHLAMLRVEESGYAEYTGYGGWGDDGLEVGEVDERSQELHTWRRLDGQPSTMGALPFEDNELCSPEVLEEIAEAEPEFEEATGNAGASFERQYQRAALVLWPRARQIEVLAAGGLSVSLPYLLEQLPSREALSRATASQRTQVREQMRRLLASWPQEPHRRLSVSRDGHGARFLHALHALGDTETFVEFITTVSAGGGYSDQEHPALIAILSELPPPSAGALLNHLVTANAARDPNACAQLLADLTAQHRPLAGEPTQAAAQALLAALPAKPMVPQSSNYDALWRAREAQEQITPELISTTLAALARIDPVLTEQALALFLKHQDVYDPDRVLIPAALAIQTGETRLGANQPVAAQLREAIIALLRQRLDQPLTPPADWRRPAPLRCHCSHCEEVRRFLNSPSDSTWHLKAAQKTRDHVSREIQSNRCDLDLRTDQRGRPYTLICTKNQASYEAQVRQRDCEEAYLQTLLAPPIPNPAQSPSTAQPSSD